MIPLLLLLAVAPNKRALAQAVDAYHTGARDVRPELRTLLAERPWDDDVAYWLARAELDNSHCDRAAELLKARDGVGVPAAAFRVHEAQAHACLGELEEAERLALEAGEIHRLDPLYAPHHALLALLSLRGHREADAARHLALAGGSPEVLPAVVRRALPDKVLGVALEQSAPGRLSVEVYNQAWALDLETGLLKAITRPETDAPPQRWVDAPADRALGRGCALPTWSSPMEPLKGGAAGIFRLETREIVLVERTFPGQQLGAPVCKGEELAWLQLSLTQAGQQMELVVAGQVQPLEGVPVDFDWGAPGLVVQELSGRMVLDGQPLWDGQGPPLSSPRWLP
ncbi:MAG: hypothetical protein VX899_02260 [Myxococcota bacterium]|nr:hypothetical protein [Myxococcota bacterium]